MITAQRSAHFRMGGNVGSAMDVGVSKGNVGRIAERIVANELEFRGYRVSDLNKEGLSANADLIASNHRGILQIQVKGAKRIAVIAATLLMSLFAYAQAGSVLTGRVVHIADGDTLTLLTGTHQQVRIRLAEIDAPESGQPWGNRSKQMLAKLVFAKEVQVEPRGQDRYGRTIARIRANGQDVNAEMIRTGAAWAYRQYLTDHSLISVEAEAKKKHRGLWAMPPNQTIAPWEWRHTRREQIDYGSPLGATSGQCGAKRYCRQMSSCEEARFYLNQCGVHSLDGDGNGVPCNLLCRRSAR